MPNAPTTVTTFSSFVPNYWDQVFGNNLFPNLYLYGLGTKRQVPANFGYTIKIPRLLKTNIVTRVNAEGVAVGPCGLSGQFISGTLLQFGGAYRHSDVVIMTAMSDVIDQSLGLIGRDTARAMDTHIRDMISGTGPSVGGAAFGSVLNANIIRSRDLLKAAVLLDRFNNPRPPDGFYPAVIHPDQGFDLQSSLTGNSWLEVNKYASDNSVEHLYRGEMGRIFGVRIIATTNTKRLTGAGGVSAGNSGYRGFVLAPDSYYVTEINEMTAKTFIKGLGSAGALDPINQIATVGAKVMFTAIPVNYPKNNTTEARIVRLVHGSASFN